MENAIATRYAKKEQKSLASALFVIQQGLEPWTPSLKGMCSTC